MKKKQFREEQILAYLKAAEAGTPVPELCRKSCSTPRRCARLYPESIDPTGEARGSSGDAIEAPISERSACRLVGVSRTVLHYQGAAQPLNDELKGRLVELTGERRRFGFRRLHVLVRREGWRVNHKRTWRMYREGELHVRRRRRRGHPTKVVTSPTESRQ